MKLFRSGLSPHHTALAMIGAKRGATVIVIGAADPALAAEVGLVTGLNGRTVVLDVDEGARASVQSAAGKAGALVDFELLTAGRVPFDADSADVVVIQQELGARPDTQRVIVGEAVRVARDGGRVVVIEGERRTGLFSKPRVAAPLVTGESIVVLLTGAGLIAVRVLAETEGVVYVEGRKK